MGPVMAGASEEDMASVGVPSVTISPPRSSSHRPLPLPPLPSPPRPSPDMRGELRDVTLRRTSLVSEMAGEILHPRGL